MPFRNPGEVTSKRAALWDKATQATGQPFTTWAPEAIDEGAYKAIEAAKDRAARLAEATK